MEPTAISPCDNDAALGPSVHGCRGDFDFTQKFERIFFSIVPAAVFIGLALARGAALLQRSKVAGGVWFQHTKSILLAVYAALQFSILIVLAASSHNVVHKLTIASAALTFVASISSLALSYLEHSLAYRPSSLLLAYLLLTLLFDIAQARTAWLSITTDISRVLARLFTATVAVKFIALGLESVPKRRWIHWDADEHSPEEASSIFSLSVFFWTRKLFHKGYTSVLNVDDLYSLDVAMASEKLYQDFTAKSNPKSYSKYPQHGLLRETCRVLAVPLLLPVAPRLAQTGFTYAQPFFINSVLTYLTHPMDERDPSIGYGLIGASVIIYTGIAVSTAIYQYFVTRSAFLFRGTLVSTIYKKTTLAQMAANDNSAAITLMSADIERIVRAMDGVHEIWANTIEVAIGAWLLYDQLGVAFLATLGIILLTGGILLSQAGAVRKTQAGWLGKIQVRVGLTSKVISNMKLYKISGMTGPVMEQIQTLRVEEITAGTKFRWIAAASAILGYTPTSIAPVLTFAATSRTLDIATVFTSLSYISLVCLPLSILFQRLPLTLTALTCFNRIQKYLTAEARHDFREFPISEAASETSSRVLDKSPAVSAKVVEVYDPSLPAFEIANASFGWGGEKMTLNNINAKIPLNKLTLIIGPVASGKSTFCKVLLGELPVYGGRVIANVPRGVIGYCEQTPFLYNMTLKENIIGHNLFDQARYDEVIHATLLDVDVQVLPNGHDTKIGSNGIMLSGGQKQRVSVARALYSDSQAMVFDDVLSGLDTDTESELFRRIFGPQGIVTKRAVTAVVCTHSVRHLPVADHIIALDTSGQVVEEGTFSRLMENDSYVRSLKVKAHDAKQDTADTAVAGQDTAGQKDELVPPTKSTSKAVAAMDRARQTGDRSVYLHYLRTCSALSLIGFLSFTVFGAFGESFPSVWLKYWAEDSFHRGYSFYIGLYALLSVTSVLALVGVLYFCYITMVRLSGTALHHNAIKTVVKAPLQFFTNTDSGVVTNLFSQDMTLIDGELPGALMNTCFSGLTLIGQGAVIATASAYLAISYPFLVGILYVIQRFYLRTSRQLRLLDLEAKSPLYTHFADTILGVATIRAFGWQSDDMARHYKLLDTSQRPAYLLSIIQKWIQMAMQMLVALLAVGVVALSTQLHSNAGLTGASLVTLLRFGEIITGFVQSYTQLETSIGAVNRLKTFSEVVVPEDQPDEDLEPPLEWPAKGSLKISGVSASYEGTMRPASAESSSTGAQTPKLVIDNLSLDIRPGEKVAVCGRTGSGKSTLILLLLRLLDPLWTCSENIQVDGLPFHRIDRGTLRKRIIAIPQDAVFLPDGRSIKSHLDPFELATDEECTSTLEAVQLSTFLSSKGDLHSPMNADDLSAGQKQLFSLGRAILRKRVRERMADMEKMGGILLLDEVSSSVDKVTDRIMQDIIKEEFVNYTVIMVSHRLEMVVDYFDRVVVLDRGAMVETGCPKALVNQEGSRFGELWRMGNHGAEG